MVMAVNGYVEPLIYNDENLDMLGWCLLIGVVLCSVSYIVGFFIAWLHHESEKEEGLEVDFE
jgi:hypothetical protein